MIRPQAITPAFAVNSTLGLCAGTLPGFLNLSDESGVMQTPSRQNSGVNFLVLELRRGKAEDVELRLAGDANGLLDGIREATGEAERVRERRVGVREHLPERVVAHGLHDRPGDAPRAPVGRER